MFALTEAPRMLQKEKLDPFGVLMCCCVEAPNVECLLTLNRLTSRKEMFILCIF